MVRQILDLFIYLSQHTMVAFLCFLAMWLLGCRFLGLDQRLLCLSGRKGRKALLWLSSVLVIIFLFISIWYLALDGFGGEVEPMVSSLSWMIQDGHPLYHEVDSPARYSVLYGPSVFLTNGLFLKILGPSLFSAKIASALAGLASLLLLYAAVARRRLDPVGLMVVSLAVLYLWCQGFAVHLVRPDSLLLFSVCLGIYSALRLRRNLAILAVGVILGFAINLKIHAGFYFLPILVILKDRFGWRCLVQAGIIAFVVVWSPFALHPQISLANYLVWLKNAMGHGLGMTSIFETSRFALVLLIPMAALLVLNRSAERWIKEHLGLLLGFGCGMVAVLVLSTKPGAGLVHLLPLVPTVLYIDSLLIRELPPEFRAWIEPSFRRDVLGRGVLAAVLMTILLAGTVHEYRVCKLIQWENQNSGALIADLAEIQSTYPGLSLGMAVGGENACFRSTWMRPLLVFNHHPLLLDPVAVMDCHLSGMSIPDETFMALASGQIAVWLVPKSQKPFAKTNWYAPHEPIFTRAFMEHFQANYSAQVQSEFFDLWIWDGLSIDGLGEPALASLKSGKIGG